MEIRILGYLPASWLLEQEPQQWHALVVLDSGKRPTEFVAAQARSHLYLHFDDIDQPFGSKQVPTQAAVERGLEFARGKDRLLVSCRAGRGRSVALGYLMACQNLGVDEAIKLLDPTRHHPNRLVIQLGDALLGNPHILDRFDDWRHRHSHINQADYYEQLEIELDTLEAKGARDRISAPGH
jgi:predicted protein tyrosine phosphatase